MAKQTIIVPKQKVANSGKVTSDEARRNKGRKRKRKNKPLLMFLLISVIVLLFAGAFFIYAVVIPAQRIVESAEVIKDTSEQLMTDFEDKDLTKLDEYSQTIKLELDKINTEIDQYKFLDNFALTRGYYENLQTVRKLALKSQVFIDTTLPKFKVFLESLGYKVETNSEAAESDSDKANEEKVKALVKELPKLVEFYEDIEPDIRELIEIFNDVDPDYVPSIGTGDYRAKIQQLQKLTLEFPAISAQLKNTLRIMPDLLGSDEPANYLVILQNEKELRASGGLLSSYGNLTIDGGELNEEISIVDMWDVQYDMWNYGLTTGKENIYGQKVLMNRGCGATALRPQDSGLYPDLHWTMNTFTDYYDLVQQRLPEKYPEYDHVVIFNTFFASDLVDFVDPLEFPEENKTITADNLAKEIFSQTSEQSFATGNRKEFIGDVATKVQEKFNNLQVEDFVGVVKTVIKSIQARHIAFISEQEKVQAYFDEFGMSGRFAENFAGDYFHFNEAQNCSLKMNFYVDNTITQDIHIREDGSIKKDVYVHWENSKIYDPAEKMIYSDKANFRYRAWVRVFAPEDTEFTYSNGYKASDYIYDPQTYYDEVMEKAVSDNVIRFDHRRFSESDPIKTEDLQVSYTLPGKLNYQAKGEYRMLLQKHPGKEAENYTINVHHQNTTTSTSFQLDRDKVLTYRDGVITVENYDERLDEYTEMLNDLQLE